MHQSTCPTARFALALTAGTMLLGSSLLAQKSKPGVRSEIEIAGGKVAVTYHPVALSSQPLEKIQSKGKVWSIGEFEAAQLTTEVALMAGKTLIPPGTHRLSTWFKGPNDWRLLIFSGPRNFKRGTPYRSLRLRKTEYEKPKSELLKVEIVKSRKVVALQIFAGTTRLRVTLDPLEVIRHEGELAGSPAVFEFYKYRADFRIQGRLRDLELIPFGRVATKGEFGASYDMSCKSDGNGLFVILNSGTLKKNRQLLVQASKDLEARPQDTKLKAKIGKLQQAIAKQSKLQTNVMVPGTVEKVKSRAGHLGVQPELDSDGTSFELSFGIRKAKFILNPSQFHKLEWR